MSKLTLPSAETPTGPGETGATVFMPEEMIGDAMAIANHLQKRLGEVLWAFWELAKPDIYNECTSPEDNKILPPTPARLPEGFDRLRSEDLPREPLSFGGEKLSLTIVLPARVLTEVQALAIHADRSTSWIFQKTFIITRSKL